MYIVARTYPKNFRELMGMRPFKLLAIEVIGSIQHLEEKLDWLLVIRINECIYIQQPAYSGFDSQFLYDFPTQTFFDPLPQLKVATRKSGEACVGFMPHHEQSILVQDDGPASDDEFLVCRHSNTLAFLLFPEGHGLFQFLCE